MTNDSRLNDLIVRFAIIEQCVLNLIAADALGASISRNRGGGSAARAAQSEAPIDMLQAVMCDLRRQFSDAGSLNELGKTFVYRAQTQLDETEARLTRLIGISHGVPSRHPSTGERK